MTSHIIEPDFVIELNQDYTISNHGIHKQVCVIIEKLSIKLQISISSRRHKKVVL